VHLVTDRFLGEVSITSGGYEVWRGVGIALPGRRAQYKAVSEITPGVVRSGDSFATRQHGGRGRIVDPAPLILCCGNGVRCLLLGGQ
jgi:hypothetical protein